MGKPPAPGRGPDHPGRRLATHEVEATAATTSGRSVAVAGTMPTPQALEALLLAQHIGDIGFTTRLS